ncbi:MAG: sugar phosphate isomerase/epimerase family protein [Phycisphaeraceae bacterium]
MKLSFMTFACPQWTFDEVVDAARRHRYQGIEFRCDAKHDHGVEVFCGKDERKQFRQKLEAYDLEACCLATSLRFADEQAIAEAPERLELAAAIGCPALRVFCGPKPPGVESMEQLIPIVARNLAQVAELAEHHHVKLWLETHDTFCRAADAAAAVRMANHPFVGLNYDNMHPFRHGEPLETTFAEIGGLVQHCHFHDAMNKPDKVIITPVAKGEMPMDEMFAALVKLGYDGYVSGEWFNDQYGKTPDDSLAQFHEDMTTLAERHGVRMGA